MTRHGVRRWPVVIALSAAAILIVGALALWTTRGEALLLDLAGTLRAALCM